MVVKKGFQSDGQGGRLERIALRLVKDGGKEVAYYKFAINPENYKESYPQRSTVFKTRSASVVEDYGRDLPMIEFSGTTGHRRDRDGRTGAQRLAVLKDFIERYSNAGHKVNDENQVGLEMYFYNLTDGGSYIVHLAKDGFQIERSIDKPLLYNYRISLVVIRYANDPDIRDIDKAKLGNSYFYETTSEAINPNSATANYDRAVRELTKQLG